MVAALKDPAQGFIDFNYINKNLAYNISKNVVRSQIEHSIDVFETF